MTAFIESFKLMWVHPSNDSQCLISALPQNLRVNRTALKLRSGSADGARGKLIWRVLNTTVNFLLKSAVIS